MLISMCHLVNLLYRLEFPKKINKAEEEPIDHPPVWIFDASSPLVERDPVSLNILYHMILFTFIVLNNKVM